MDSGLKPLHRLGKMLVLVAALLATSHSGSVFCPADDADGGVGDEAMLLQLSSWTRPPAAPGPARLLLLGEPGEREVGLTNQAPTASGGQDAAGLGAARLLPASADCTLGHGCTASRTSALFEQFVSALSGNAAASAVGRRAAAARAALAQPAGGEVIIVVLVGFVLLGVAALVMILSALSARESPQYQARRSNSAKQGAYPGRGAYPPGSDARLSGGLSSQDSLRPADPSQFSPARPAATLSTVRSATAGPSSPQNNILCPELHGAIVPKEKKFLVQIPTLLGVPRTAEGSLHLVATSFDESMFEIKLVRRTPNPNESIQLEESFTISLPDESQRELALCAFGREAGGDLQCEIFKPDRDGRMALFGHIGEDRGKVFEAKQGFSAYTLALASGARLITVAVKGDLKNRQLKIVNGQGPSNEIASTIPGGRKEHYLVECYPHSDVILTVIALAAVDRLATAAAKGG